MISQKTCENAVVLDFFAVPILISREKLSKIFWVKNPWKCWGFVKLEFLDKSLTFRVVWFLRSFEVGFWTLIFGPFWALILDTNLFRTCVNTLYDDLQTWPITELPRNFCWKKWSNNLSSKKNNRTYHHLKGNAIKYDK